MNGNAFIRLAPGLIAAALLSANPIAVSAQSAAAAPPPGPAALAVPTTKLLAIGSLTAQATPEALARVLPSEVRATARLYLAGKIDQWYVKQDHTGVVFILNLTDPEAAHAMLEALPLGQAGLMQFQIIPLGPLSPLRLLLAKPS